MPLVAAVTMASTHFLFISTVNTRNIYKSLESKLKVLQTAALSFMQSPALSSFFISFVRGLVKQCSLPTVPMA